MAKILPCWILIALYQMSVLATKNADGVFLHVYFCWREQEWKKTKPQFSMVLLIKIPFFIDIGKKSQYLMFLNVFSY